MSPAIGRSERRQWPAAGAALIALALLTTMPARAQTAPLPSPPSTPSLKWAPFIDLDGKAGTERNIGEGDLFMPLLQNGDSMLFADLRGKLDDRSDDEGNFGLGFRHMLSAGWNLGAYGYYDRRSTALGSIFEQATFGAEALSLDWDARANVYQPIGPSVRNLSTSSSSTSSSTSTSTSSSTSSSSAALANTSVQVTTTTTTTTNTTTATTTTTTIQTTQEVEQKGFDGEIGWRVPVFAADASTQLRVYAGGYRFTGNGVSPVQGPRGRLDLTIDQVPHLWNGARLELDTEVQHDTPRGTQAFAELRLRIPLQIFGEAPPELSAIERRMEDPIVRDVDIVSQPRAASTTASSSSTGTSSSSSSSSLVETATETSGGTAFTVINSSSTTGANLQTAVQGAGSGATVILSGTFNVGSGSNFATGFNQTVESGAISVSTATGHTATLNTSATITGTNPTGAGVVEVKAGTTLQGLTVTATATGANNVIAVRVDDSAVNATLTNNTVTATASGSGAALAVDVGSSTSITATGNTFTATGNGTTSGTVSAFTYVGSQTVTAANNTFSASGGTTNTLVNLNVTSTTITNSTGNIVGSGNTGTCSTSGIITGEISFIDGTHCP